MKKRLKRILCLTLTMSMLFSAVTVYATDTTVQTGDTTAVTGDTTATTGDTTATTGDTTAQTGDTAAQEDGTVSGTVTPNTTSTEQKSTETAKADTTTKKPYLSLGADLTEDQKSTVLGLLGVDAAQLDNYDVVYVSNDEEHKYLDSYLDSGEIGSKSWSSVVVYQADAGSGINITTKNISYCTQGMYENACATAGITDANIVVAGPTPISGTAALVGIFKAYQEMTGKTISEDVIDGALNELIVTGNLEDTIANIDPKDLEALIAYAKQYMAEHNLTDEASIGEAVDEACKEYSVTLTDDEKNQIVSLLLKLSKLNLDADSLSSVISGLQSASGALTKVGGFFTNIGNAISGFFKKLFG